MTPTSVAANRIGVVTGSNQGIGYFIALQLGLTGKFSNIILACRNPERGNEAVQKIQKEVGDKVAVSCEPFTLGDIDSHTEFAKKMEENFGKVDVLVNNAGLAFKGADPTPFNEQTKPTLDVNFRGTVDFSERMLPLLRKGEDARLVNVSSMAGRLGQVSKERQQQFASESLTIEQLKALMNEFESDVQSNTHKQKGWSNTNYGMSKLGVTAATKILARDPANSNIAINCICPGYCSTSMSSYGGTRSASDGANNAVIPATMDNPPTGEFFEDFKVSTW